MGNAIKKTYNRISAKRIDMQTRFALKNAEFSHTISTVLSNEYSHDPSRRIWGKKALALGTGTAIIATLGSIGVYIHNRKDLHESYEFTLAYGQTPWKLIRGVYDDLHIHAIMEKIFPEKTYPELNTEESLFNIFFIACEVEIVFFKEKDIFEAGTIFTIDPHEILTAIAAQPDTWAEEREEKIRLHLEKKSLAKQLKEKEKSRTTGVSGKKVKPSEKKDGQNHKIQETSNVLADRHNNAYVRTYASLAQQEMHKYNIPASITLAQGIIESGSGKSKLTKVTNNHFCIKCTNPSCRDDGKYGPHCTNHDDDDIEDRFKNYSSVDKSYRAHSQFLSIGRYHILHNADISHEEARDHFNRLYKKQTHKKRYTRRKQQRKKAIDNRDNREKRRAYGLEAMGYATKAGYAESLLGIIEKNNLTVFDQ